MVVHGEVGIEVCAFVICDFLIFFWERRAQGKGGEMGKVELVGLVEVVVFWGGLRGLLRGVGMGCGCRCGMEMEMEISGGLERSRGEGEEARKGNWGGRGLGGVLILIRRFKYLRII